MKLHHISKFDQRTAELLTDRHPAVKKELDALLRAIDDDIGAMKAEISKACAPHRPSTKHTASDEG